MILFTLIVLTIILVGCSGNVEENITGKVVDTSIDDSSICIIDSECDDENPTGSEITGSVIQDVGSGNAVVVYFFWGDGCPHCAEEKPFLDELKQKYPSLDIKMFETWYNRENAELFQKTAELYGTSAQGVPTTFIGDKYWVGFADYMKSEMESYLKYCLENECLDKIKQ